MSKKTKEEQPVVRPTPVPLTDNDILMLLQAAELNAGSKAASVYQKQVFSALNELYRLRTTPKYIVTTQLSGGETTWSAPNEGPKCPQCGEWYISIPRIGIGHICKANS